MKNKVAMIVAVLFVVGITAGGALWANPLSLAEGWRKIYIPSPGDDPCAPYGQVCAEYFAGEDNSEFIGACCIAPESIGSTSVDDCLTPLNETFTGLRDEIE